MRSRSFRLMLRQTTVPRLPAFSRASRSPGDQISIKPPSLSWLTIRARPPAPHTPGCCSATSSSVKRRVTVMALRPELSPHEALE
jgi:DNA-binding transcriptional regulator YdaS (Cro superfamily)